MSNIKNSRLITLVDVHYKKRKHFGLFLEILKPMYKKPLPHFSGTLNIFGFHQVSKEEEVSIIHELCLD